MAYSAQIGVDKVFNWVLVIYLYGGYMYRTGNANWLSRLFFLFTGLFFTWAAYYLCTVSIDPAYYGYMRSASAGTPVTMTGADTDRILLPLDSEITVGAHQFTYKGKREGCLLIDVLIPALDKGFAYRHFIPMSQAKEGFNLAGREFVLVALNRQVAKIRTFNTD